MWSQKDSGISCDPYGGLAAILFASSLNLTSKGSREDSHANPIPNGLLPDPAYILAATASQLTSFSRKLVR
jgi:hypothetical protein